MVDLVRITAELYGVRIENLLAGRAALRKLARS